MSPEDAHHAALRKFGNLAIIREEVRAVWVPRVLDDLAQDIRYACRSLRRQPGFTVAAVVMLTVGLGLVAGGYTVFNGLFVRGWTVPDSDAVFRVRAERAARPEVGMIGDGVSEGLFESIQKNARSADYVGMRIHHFRVRADSGSGGAHTGGMLMSANAIEALRIPLQLGTGFGGVANTERRILISDGLWHRIFGADPQVVGRTAWISGVPSTILGVTARGFEGLGERRLDLIAEISASDAWVRWDADDRTADGTMCCVMVAGRIRDGWTRRQVQEELSLLTAQYRQATGQAALSVTLEHTAPGESIRRGGDADTIVTALSLVGGGIVLVLLLTCANVGNLFLARSLRREREIAVRLSLGASRPRVVRQLLTEGLVMAAIAGGTALLFTLALPAMMPLVENNAPTNIFMPDWRVAAFTVAGVIGTCLLVALAPALQTTRIAWRGATATMSPRTGRIRSLVLAMQIAIATVLVISATLLARGIVHALSVPADFALQTTTAITLQPPANKTYTPRQGDQMRLDFARAIETSGASFGIAGTIPASARVGMFTFTKVPGSEVVFRCKLVPLTAAAANLLELGLVTGRWASDDLANQEIVLNATLARQMWPGESAVGKSVMLGFTDRTYVVVGVARDAHLTSLSAVEPMAHVPLTVGLPVLLARTEPGLDQRVKTLVAAVDPELTATLTPLSESVRDTLHNAMAGVAIAGALGAVALLLAIIGVFGVFSYLVEERRYEIGIRLAMGASRRQVAAALARATRGAVTGGLIGGLALSFAAGIALQRFLFGLSPADPLTYLIVATVLGLAALLATAGPVRRAVRVDPAVTLKAE
jgi:putative ABC transport system permease protein